MQNNDNAISKLTPLPLPFFHLTLKSVISIGFFDFYKPHVYIVIFQVSILAHHPRYPVSRSQDCTVMSESQAYVEHSASMYTYTPHKRTRIILFLNRNLKVSEIENLQQTY
jgi:hypothetical protein